MWLRVTVRELSLVMSFCRFCHFLIYNSVRFIYISFTFLFTCFFLSCLLESPPCHFWCVMRAMRGKSLILNSFFLAKRLPKLAVNATKMASPWVLKGFFIVKCVMSLFYSAQAQIIITSHCCAPYSCNATLLYKTMLQCNKQCNAMLLFNTI